MLGFSAEYTELQGASEVPTRIVGANIPYESVLYLIALVVVAIIVLGVVWRVRSWGKTGLDENGRFKLGSMVRIAAEALGQRQMERSLGSGGIFHACVVWSMIVLLLNSAIDAVAHFSGSSVQGDLYIVMSASADIAGAVLLVGLIGLAVIKFIVRPERQDPRNLRSLWVMIALMFACLSGFFVEGTRIAGQLVLTTEPGALDYEAIASPIGWQVAKLFAGVSLDQILVAHRVFWWTHALFIMTGLALLPFGRLWHVIAAMGNGANKNAGQLDEIEDIEDESSLGTEKVKDLRWFDFADLDACMECGACSVACPACNAGYPLNPKLDIILSLRDEAKRVKAGEEERDLHAVIGDEALWNCVTCKACVQACPLGIDHVSKLVDVRRRVTLWDEQAPDLAQAMFIGLDLNQNPWGMGFATRADWLRPMGIDEMIINLEEQPDATFDYLLFAGCFAAFDLRYRRAVAAGVKLLTAMGLKIAYLGTRECCCGDSARRLGNELLYQELASKNLETFRSFDISKILVFCPHCLNMLRNEYTRLDPTFDVPVFYFSEVAAEMLAQRSDLRVPERENVLVQEPCYLARYSSDSDRIVEALTNAGLSVLNEGDSFGPTCCGGGGGCMWLDDASTEKAARISETRLKMLSDKAAEKGTSLEDSKIVTGCPYCMTMLDDALSGEGSKVRTIDVAEVLWQGLEEKVK